ncbi:hypothetical protein L873DRAFT_1822990 [Choiromyces venosus 120613-1]|uniref:Uncharacterized protein n=1 Tax=Choiromyces venosus 120613-1 TaxID=1336337 RepID=A0A3N4ITT3_9PEZI|nr:hypothetical protein L873DRAFT_1822990 [Choiromyces venosus 120613-1]
MDDALPKKRIPLTCSSVLASLTTRNFLTFVNTTAIAYGQKTGRSPKISVVRNSSCAHKRQKITSTRVGFLNFPSNQSVLWTIPHSRVHTTGGAQFQVP